MQAVLVADVERSGLEGSTRQLRLSCTDITHIALEGAVWRDLHAAGNSALPQKLPFARIEGAVRVGIDIYSPARFPIAFEAFDQNWKPLTDRRVPGQTKTGAEIAAGAADALAIDSMGERGDADHGEHADQGDGGHELDQRVGAGKTEHGIRTSSL